MVSSLGIVYEAACGWAPWPSPTFINPVDDSLLSDNELALKQIVRTYSDPLDQQVCYLDFWAMLWVDGTHTVAPTTRLP